MATRDPLVLIGGRPSVLPAGDTLSGASGGAAGGATTTRVEVDFGTAPGVHAKSFSVTVAGVSAGQAVVAAPSLDMPAGVAADELEMDPISAAAHATAADTVLLIVGAASRLTGKRAINIIR